MLCASLSQSVASVVLDPSLWVLDFKITLSSNHQDTEEEKEVYYSQVLVSTAHLGHTEQRVPVVLLLSVLRVRA